jgi:hypothetical protein
LALRHEIIRAFVFAGAAAFVASTAAPAMAQGESCTSMASEIQALQTGLTQVSAEVRENAASALSLELQTYTAELEVEFQNSRAVEIKSALQSLSLKQNGLDRNSAAYKNLDAQIKALQSWLQSASFALSNAFSDALDLHRRMKAAAERGRIGLEASILLKAALQNVQQDYDQCVKAATAPPAKVCRFTGEWAGGKTVSWPVLVSSNTQCSHTMTPFANSAIDGVDVTDAAQGKTWIAGTTVFYKPNAGYKGADSFVVTVAAHVIDNGKASTAIINVSVTVQ